MLVQDQLNGPPERDLLTDQPRSLQFLPVLQSKQIKLPALALDKPYQRKSNKTAHHLATVNSLNSDLESLHDSETGKKLYGDTLKNFRKPKPNPT